MREDVIRSTKEELDQCQSVINAWHAGTRDISLIAAVEAWLVAARRYEIVKREFLEQVLAERKAYDPHNTSPT